MRTLEEIDVCQRRDIWCISSVGQRNQLWGKGSSGREGGGLG